MPRTTTVASATTEVRTAFVSSTYTGHLDLTCTGLDRMREQGRDTSQYLEPVQAPTLGELFTGAGSHDDVIPCRICDLEPFLTGLVPSGHRHPS